MFQFANGYGTTTGARGFDTDDNQFIRDWSNFNQEILSQSQENNNFSYNTNDVAGGYTHNTLFTWLWTLISPELPPIDAEHDGGQKLHINFQAKSYSTENALNDRYMSDRDEVNFNTARYSRPPASRHEIDIYYIKKGHDALKYYHAQHADKEIPGISTLLTVDRYHKINVIRGTSGKITILSTRWDEMMMFKVIGLLPVFFPDIKKVVDTNPAIYAILKAFFDNDPESIKTIANDTMKNFIAMLAKRNINKLFTTLDSQKNKVIKQLESSITAIQQTIDSYHQELSAKYEELEDTRRSLADYVVNPFTIDPNLRSFLEKSTTIKILKVIDNNNIVQTQFTTPIMNWNKQDVEMYFKHDPRTQETYLNNPDWFAEIMKKIFIDEEYQILCTTVVDMPMINQRNADDVFATEHSPEGTYGNPHFTDFNCYRASRGAYIKAIVANDYVRAFSIILAATATLVFTDSAVIRHMAEHMKEHGSAYNKKIIKNMQTGEIISIKNLRERLAAEKQKSAEPATETPTPITMHPTPDVTADPA
jgi:hypothetical protein